MGWGGEGWHNNRLELFKEERRCHNGILSLVNERDAESLFDPSSVLGKML